MKPSKVKERYLKAKKESGQEAVERQAVSLDEVTGDGMASVPVDFLNIESTSKYLHCSISKLYSQVERGTIPFMRNEGQILFFKPDLIDWLKTKRCGAIFNPVTGLFESHAMRRAAQ